MKRSHPQGRSFLRGGGRLSNPDAGARGSRRGRFGGLRGGGQGLRLGRVLSAADLQLIVLGLLEERPRHGYDLIKAIEELTGGTYVPSPGMVYPALSYLEEVGQAAAEADGTKKQYRLTPAGLELVNASRQRIAALFDALRRVGARLAARAQPASEQPGATDAPQSGPAVLEAARRDLKAALFDNLDASPEEQQRIAAILQRTIAEIRKR